jgi:uncharacterized protein YecT (DUF1311 family)
MPYRWVGLLVLLTIAAPAVAQEKTAAPSVQYSKVFEACLDKSGGVTVEIRDCDSAEYAIWDKRLNVAYAAIMSSDNHSSAAKAKLKEAQRAWIVFRDKGCLADGEIVAEGGTASSLIASDCGLQLTAERAVHLEKIVQ